jgi:hypothetical protein
MRASEAYFRAVDWIVARQSLLLIAGVIATVALGGTALGYGLGAAVEAIVE